MLCFTADSNHSTRGGGKGDRLPFLILLVSQALRTLGSHLGHKAKGQIGERVLKKFALTLFFKG